MAMMTCVASAFAQKKLVLYYSEVGSTKAVAEEIQKQTEYQQLRYYLPWISHLVWHLCQSDGDTR